MDSKTTLLFLIKAMSIWFTRDLEDVEGRSQLTHMNLLSYEKKNSFIYLFIYRVGNGYILLYNVTTITISINIT